MGFEISELRRQPEGAMYVAPERLCVTADGTITSEDDPLAVRLLVAKGAAIPAREAAEYGLIAEEDAVEEPSDVDEAAEEAPKRRRR